METTKIKKKAGRISPTPMGDYDNTTTYRRLDWVYYGGTSYICKKNNTLGISPTDTGKWQKIIELPTELKMIFDEAITRENIISGEKLSVILGKIQKCIADIKDIAFTGSYNDLSDKPTSLKNPNALTIKFNGTTQSTYDGSIKKEVDVTPSVIAAVPATNVLTNKEQVLANTNASNIASAVALKNINNDLVNSISEINSNLTNGINQINNLHSDLFKAIYGGKGHMPYTGSDCNDAPFGFSWDSNYTLNGVANCPPIYGGYILRLGESDWGAEVAISRDSFCKIYIRNICNGVWTDWVEK